MKKKIWGCILLVLMVIAMGCYFFWEDILIAVAPKVVLTTSLSNVMRQLEERFDNDPIWMLMKVYNPEGQYTAKIDMQTENKILGSVNYDMAVQTDLKAHRIHATGKASAEQREIDLSLYLDADCMAVSSDGLAGGQYYGIYYDSFAQDIRSIPLLKFMIGNDVLSAWEESVNKIQKGMKREVVLAEIPEIKPEEVHALLLAAIALPCQMEKTTLWLEDEAITCRKMDYYLEGTQIGAVMSRFMNQSFDGNTSAQVSFYLYEKTLVRITVICKSGDQNIQMTVDLGTNPLGNPISIKYSKQGVKTNSNINARINTLQAENLYSERWDIQSINNGKEVSFACQYDWNPNSGEMELCLNDTPDTVSVIFNEHANGIDIQMHDLGSFMKMFPGVKSMASWDKNIECAMIVSKGSDIDKPEYKNLNQWTVGDFWELISGLGALIGINLK